MRCTKSSITEGVFLLRFDTQYGLASSFLRIQEHYESIQFKDRVFTLEQYMDWYVDRFGAFTYYQDWSGFNVPSSAFDAFYDGKFDPLLEKERRLLQLFEAESRPFYVIGISTHQDLKHELAHALFFTRPDYRKAVRAAMRGYDTKPLEKRLTAVGYHRSVLADEVHAYLVSPSEGPEWSTPALAGLRRKLRTIYRHHAQDLTASRLFGASPRTRAAKATRTTKTRALAAS
jgi:hypothetical protein